ncbi:ribbon-helix-helix domain-containing protein [Brunnivagina elsteri]|uniref:ribbon-helix-helix domain-containing protein n=1 Tax=Brunnivagina elsteri TaxID=1247191 RepID=UPI001474BB96
MNVTLADSVLDDLEVWAASQGRPTANLAAFLIEMSIKLAKNSGEFPDNSSVITRKP